ncbi:MAG: sarcosine oxidase subunit beta family protein [Alphaproteobacteria bacterium]
MRYSAWSLLREAFGGHRGWSRVWRDPEPQARYDIVIVGAGGHGLATAYYLAKNHGVRSIAVLEKGWLGGGNTGRNTTIVRSNYLLPENNRFYEWSLQLWEGLSQDLNFNVMFSQRGVVMLAHGPDQVDALTRRGNSMRLNGIDAEWLDRQAMQDFVPQLDYSDQARFPIAGGLLQPRGGTARHDAVAWGFARAADSLGVDIIQNCEVTGFNIQGGRVRGLDTTRGYISCEKVGLAVAGHTGHLAGLAGLRLPIESHVLQACVSEPVKPMFDTVVSFGRGHFYVSQSDKGGMVFGGDLDGYNSYAQRGNLPMMSHVAAAGVSMFPGLSRLKLLRHWGGIMDMTMDGSPIITESPVGGLYINGGWCYGGFKATPGSGWVFAHTLATGKPHPLNEPFTLDRFRTGHLLNEGGGGPVPNVH